MTTAETWHLLFDQATKVSFKMIEADKPTNDGEYILSISSTTSYKRFSEPLVNKRFVEKLLLYKEELD